MNMTALLATPVTVVFYEAMRRVHARHPGPWTLPVLTTTFASALALGALGWPLESYERGTSPLAWFLGPATVALAVPLVRERALIRRKARAVLLGVTAGAVSAAASAVMLAWGLGLPPAMVRTVVSKSVTTPVAMPIARSLGGSGELAAAVVMVTGLFGMVAGPRILSTARVRSPLARGLSLGTAAHGIGTAAAMSEAAESGAASALAMVIAAIVTALLAPAVDGWLPR
jgi:putative effector of murein hydrolase